MLFGANADWKGFNINVSFLYQCGGQVYNQTLVDRVEDANLSWNVDRRVLKGRWKELGDHTFFKDIRIGIGRRFLLVLFRMRTCYNLNHYHFLYSFPTELIQRWSLERLKLTFQMEDIFRISNVKRERGLITRLPEFLTWDYRFNFNPVEM